MKTKRRKQGWKGWNEPENTAVPDGHSDIGVTLNVYMHLGLEDAAAEMARMKEVETARKEQAKVSGEREEETRRMFRVI